MKEIIVYISLFELREELRPIIEREERERRERIDNFLKALGIRRCKKESAWA
jgi:hypothetical protein